jgi:hypothetical protein
LVSQPTCSGRSSGRTVVAGFKSGSPEFLIWSYDGPTNRPGMFGAVTQAADQPFVELCHVVPD